MKYLLSSLLYLVFATMLIAQTTDNAEFVSLFDGKTLTGWTPSTDNPDCFSVENGHLMVRGGRAHLFYTGENGNVNIKNFELKLKIKTTANSNSGVYFHTRYQEDGWPNIGFEAQVNSTHADPKKTGSLYGVVNIWAPLEVEAPFLAKVGKNRELYILQPKAPSTDGEWFDYHITVKDKHIIVKVNGMTTVDWTQPDDWSKDRRIGSGTFALQAHDPKCVVHYKDIQLKVLK